MTGLIILGFGLLFWLVALFSFAQGLRDLSSIAFFLGLFFNFAGHQIYKNAKRRKFIGKRQVARLFGVSESTIDRWLHEGKLPKSERRFGLRKKWDYDELVTLLKRKPKI